MPNYYIHELLVHEAYRDMLMGHFRVAMTLNVLHEHFYWKDEKRYIQNL